VDVVCDVLSEGNLPWAGMFVERFWRCLDAKVCGEGRIGREAEEDGIDWKLIQPDCVLICSIIGPLYIFSPWSDWASDGQPEWAECGNYGVLWDRVRWTTNAVFFSCAEYLASIGKRRNLTTIAKQMPCSKLYAQTISQQLWRLVTVNHSSQ
jgi:hypothetical protein